MDKFKVLVVTPDSSKSRRMEEVVQRLCTRPTIFTAEDGQEASAKIKNVPPNLVITDLELAKFSGTQLVNSLLTDKSLSSLAILVADRPPTDETYIDELVTGRVQFLTDPQDPKELTHCVAKALNYASHGDRASFRLRIMVAGEQLIREGDPADTVFLVKKGELTAYRMIEAQRVELGQIAHGEFVGEMAYIDGKRRSANVEARSECELIEIPVGTLDRLLYSRPAWSRKLLLTLSRRLNEANSKKVLNRDEKA